MSNSDPYESPQRRPGEESPAEAKLAFDLGRLLMLSALLMVSFRFAAIPLIVYLSIRHPRRRQWSRMVAAVLLLLGLLSPIDVGAPGLTRLHGQPQRGVRLVRTAAGMPAHTSLVADYGEYVSTGCGGLPCIYQPTYYVTWW